MVGAVEYQCLTAGTWTLTVENGSNSNGSYEKFADGLMICTLDISVTDQAIATAYGSLYRGARTWTFPVAFVAAPVVTCGRFRWGTGASWPNVGATSATTANLEGFDYTSRAVGTAVLISAIAIGRWK